MPIEIFHAESGSTETWLEVNDDESVTYHTEKTGWPMVRGGINPKDSHYTAEEAKAKWTSYAKDIDAAIAKIRHSHSN